nr:glycosyltransferase family 9 protein [Pseudomarimonas arenosa]
MRLSALGDVTHVVPLVHRLQAAFPDCRLTWIIGKLEHKLIGDLPGVEFIVFDKREGWSGVAQLRRQLDGRRFDVLLQMQVAARANLLSCLIRAKRRIGYDRSRSKDLHGLMINERIADVGRRHVLDAMAAFGDALGVASSAPRWDIPLSPDDIRFAEQTLPGSQPTLLISPCSSHVRRNWHAAGYAAVADHAHRQGYRVLLCGGRSQLEREMADAILQHAEAPVIDIVGKDTLKQLLALTQRADLVLTPDSGPMHMANAVGTAVIGLHAASNPQRSGPYSDTRYCVDRYPHAAEKFLGKSVSQLPWGKKIEFEGVMDLISIEDVVKAFDRFVAAQGKSHVDTSEPAK